MRWGVWGKYGICFGRCKVCRFGGVFGYWKCFLNVFSVCFYGSNCLWLFLSFVEVFNKLFFGKEFLRVGRVFGFYFV